MRWAVDPLKMTKMKEMTATMKQGQPIAIAKKRVRDAASPASASGIVLPKTDREDDFCKSFHKIPTPRQVCGDTASL